MRKLIFLALLAIGLSTACSEQSASTSSEDYKGATFDHSNPITVDKMLSQLETQDSVEVVVSAQVTEVCKKKGCWMKLKNTTGGDDLMVTFKDYGFFMPKDLDGEVIIKGVAKYETTDVATLKHYADDAGKSEEEIDAITEPEVNLVFVASGVYLGS